MKDKILLALGFTQAQIDDMAKETPEAKMEDLLIHSTEHQKKLLKNDPDFIGEIQKAEKARVLSTSESALKKAFGLTSEETKDKTFPEIVSIAQKKAAEKGNATLEQLQNENIELTNKLKDINEVEIPKIRGEVENHKKNFHKQIKIKSLVDSFDLMVSKEAAESALNAVIESQYEADIDDKGELLFKVKGTGLAPKSKDNTKVLTPKEVIESQFEEWKFLKKSNGAPPPPAGNPTYKRDDTPPARTTISSLARAEENLNNMPKKKD